MPTLNEHAATGKKFSWLTSLESNGQTNCRWVISDHIHQYNDSDSCRTISINRLIKLFEEITSEVAVSDSNQTLRNNWQSRCGRFWVTSHRQSDNAISLFKQNREDFFKRFELYADGSLILSVQDPVWTHLQPRTRTNQTSIELPEDCISALDTEAQLILNSSDQSKAA